MIKHLVVHCSDSPQDRGDNSETIHRWHKDRGWDGIGYNAVILEDGTTEMGRPEYWTGSHVRGKNSISLGVCLMGLGDDATDEQISALFNILATWKAKYPEAEVCGHSDLDSGKTCPGWDVKAWWDDVYV